MQAKVGLPPFSCTVVVLTYDIVVENTVKDCVDGLVSNWLCRPLTERARAL